MRFRLIIGALLITFCGFGQTGWKKFPETETQKVDSNGHEGLLADSVSKAPEANFTVSKTPGVVKIHVSDEIVDLDKQLKDQNENNPKIDGFTVVIFSKSGANSRNNARSFQNIFMEEFPEYVSYLSWKSPNYEVRVGDYRTKMDAQKGMQEIKKSYPSAVIKPSKIELPDLTILEETK